MNRQQLDHWLLALTRGTIQGGALAVKSFAATACASAAGMSVPALNLKQAAVVFAIGAVWHLSDFLANNPLPEADAPPSGCTSHREFDSTPSSNIPADPPQPEAGALTKS